MHCALLRLCFFTQLDGILTSRPYWYCASSYIIYSIFTVHIGAILRILGIDPGLQTTGFGVVDVQGQQLSYVASGTITTTHLPRGDLPARLKVLFDGVREVVATYQPDSSSVEIVFVNANPQATLLLGQARGACITALVSLHLPVAEYTALQLKQSIVGYGKAAKSQVQEMVMRLLKLPGLPGKDAADALGLAITHAHAGAAMQRLAAVTHLQPRSSAAFKAGRSY
jgi:crossover junction endodeoxyribonuclease RuvC